MCTISGITLAINFLSYLKFLLALVIFANGIFFCESDDILQAFGFHFIDLGAGLIVLGLMSGSVVFATKFGASKHNRFLLMLSFVVDTIVFASYLVIAADVETYTVAEFPKDMQRDCLKNSPQIYTIEECTPFYNADRTAGMRLVWEHYYSNKRSDKSIRTLGLLQSSCCGFFAPRNCIVNEAKFPPGLAAIDINPILLAQRVTCGEVPSFYPEQDDCASVSDFETGN